MYEHTIGKYSTAASSRSRLLQQPISGSGRAMAAAAAGPDSTDELMADITKRLIRTLQRGGVGVPYTLSPEEDFMSRSAKYFGHVMPITSAPAVQAFQQGDPKTVVPCPYGLACPSGRQCYWKH
ncbi:hypothetical protein CFC21_074017 [Triticum aestivum]|uniref:Uncharacterized protein n=2 Tax=Triticum aestivum TaxID=4565 RepID=A0A3B6LV03_WHEAT|nr:hypothetical protein CFC21_074017 [Triticum aestivum]